MTSEAPDRHVDPFEAAYMAAVADPEEPPAARSEARGALGRGGAG